jgi:hypothetical protein
MIRVEAIDQDDALDKAEEQVLFPNNPEDIEWGSNGDYDYHIALVEE